MEESEHKKGILIKEEKPWKQKENCSKKYEPTVKAYGGNLKKGNLLRAFGNTPKCWGETASTEKKHKVSPKKKRGGKNTGGSQSEESIQKERGCLEGHSGSTWMEKLSTHKVGATKKKKNPSAAAKLLNG